MKTILNIEDQPLSQGTQQFLKDKATVVVPEDKISPELIKIIYCRFKSALDEKYLEKFVNLESIVCNATNIDHIDTDYCSQANVNVLSLATEKAFMQENITSSAELTWALLLEASKNLKSVHLDVKSSLFDRNKYPAIQLKNKRLSIIGFGRNGKLISEFGKAFGMRIKFFDPYVDNEDIQKVEQLEEAFQNTNFVVLSLASNKNTYHLINKSILFATTIPPILINSSRGEIIDEFALIESLNEGKIKTYATDVISDEFNFRDNIIYQNRNREDIILTPHIGGMATDAWTLTERLLFEKVEFDNNVKE